MTEVRDMSLKKPSDFEFISVLGYPASTAASQGCQQLENIIRVVADPKGARLAGYSNGERLAAEPEWTRYAADTEQARVAAD